MNNRKKSISKIKISPKIEVYISILKFGFSGLLEATTPNVRAIFTAKTIWKKWINIIGRFFLLPIKEIYYRFKYSKQISYTKIIGKPCLLITSENNRNTLNFIKQQEKEAVYLASEGYVSSKDDIVVLLHRVIWFRIYLYPWMLWHFYKYYGKQALSYMDYVFKGVGQYEACLQFLEKYKPRYIVWANDHSIFPRALLMAAKTLEIPTIYIQHASVTPYFPPLDFDLSLLEGQATLDQYQSNGRVNGLVKFVGMPKFDSYINCRNTKIRVQNIGVCSNKMDEQVVVETFLRELSNTFPTITITFRPHPADDTSFNIPNKVLRSTKEENAFDFLKKQDLIIAGNTSIHLEAVLLNVVSIYYEFIPFEEDIRDMYRYCKNGLASHALDYEHLLELIKKEIEAKDTEVYKKAAYYNAVLGTENEGKSGALAIQYINEFMQGRS
ncbi:hypothetical protein [Aureispira sp. CCB-E]|uniref:hypothetical protein n=1 Tax=Aureispira sp. CCB-E TaxID=3051121 RepID=UPI0028687F18|nr:hypothetical protein [Aureispira sp. CCB-E]WMX16022.1 hypothetical protein QP953_06545 [Aureispira sp. CCB-E]